MKETDYILKWTEDLKAEVANLPFDKDDIRKGFFELLYDVAYQFYQGHILLDVSKHINNGKIAFDESINSFSKHINRLVETSKLPILTTGYCNSLNRNLLISTWSNFELCVTTFCNAIASESEKEKLQNFQFNSISKTLKQSTLTKANVNQLRKLTIKNHITHVPIVRKTDLLLKRTQNYNRDIVNDKSFLSFFGKFRNTIHTNFIYYGNDYEYIFSEAHFVFKNNEIVVWSNPFESTPQLFLELMNNLKEIWKCIIHSIQFDDLIKYPAKQSI